MPEYENRRLPSFEARRQAVERFTTRPPRRRVLPLALAGGVALATVTAGATAYVAFARPDGDLRDGTYCYSRATLDEEYRTLSGLGTPTDGERGPADAIRMCEFLWTQGWLTADRKGLDPDPDTTIVRPAPPLVACVLDGTAAVFPGPADTCSRLGLPALTPGPDQRRTGP
ncbi:hypothetical protein J2S43_006142 [Catenuloplanes nepalensis]|uniref:Secreted protein n=1 Tax=Catenuloplanes nepalensis TaxID=587533 RepID=A0ABT9N1Q6_9ACTN|nr:hypothetical protein [Catenuloplanes nepalensis]MDP9797630.1 hypothetical protein [Catenuloplanes nepalensis]